MAVTKTKFINYIRCPRYVALDKIHKDKLMADVSLEDYIKEEKDEFLSEVLDSMYDEDDNDLIEEENPQLEIMMPYYKKIEILAGEHVDKVFNTKSIYSSDTLHQESFDFNSNGIKYLCYVDIYAPHDDAFDIIEVKATTTKKFLKLGATINKEFMPLLKKDINGIYVIDGSELSEKQYNDQLLKLYDKYNNCGHYVYDLAVQRYFVEQDLKANNNEDKINKIRYYLAVLNSDYIFDGTYDSGEPIYKTDINGNDIISLIDMTDLTKNYMDKIKLDVAKVEKYILEANASPYPLGNYCEYKKTTNCKYAKVCYNILPEYNSILKYIDNHYGFEDSCGNKYMTYDLINDGMVKMEDVPLDYLNRVKNQIQREVVETDKTYFNASKIKAGIDCITYPIYHLDFETFPCPLPRLKGEKCYNQSVFQFSLHIEREPGICDKEKDHYEFLAKDHSDQREELIKMMCKYITDYKGTILVYNESFEKTRLKELAELFPEYGTQLNKMRDMIFDLLYIVKTNTKLYEALNYSNEEAKLFNYYHAKLNGSFSIKKVLPLFSSLSYKDMEVGNGNDAIVTYASFPKMTKEEFDKQYKNLLEYCKQDTWAMVEVLWGLKKLVKQV